MDRRALLKLTASLPLLGFAGRAVAADVNARGRLLVVFLRGAYDATNALVPISSDFYYTARPRLAIARPDASNPLAARLLTADWGLHPAIAAPLAAQLADGTLGFVPFAGVPGGGSRSHFEMQDRIEAGVGGTERIGGEGMLYRLAEVLGLDKAMSFSTALPLIMRGAEPLPNLALRNPRRSRLKEDQFEAIGAMYRNHALHETFAKAAELRALNEAEVPDIEMAGRGAGGAGLFAREAARIASHMRERFPLAFLELGGWDTHINQGAGEGNLARLLGQLASGLAAFAEAMGEAWQHTGVLVVSEFGRTFRENGSGGTDHGHGTVFWQLGGALAGEMVRGPTLALSEGSLHEGRDYPVLVDYRAVFADATRRVFGLDRARLARVFGEAALAA